MVEKTCGVIPGLCWDFGRSPNNEKVFPYACRYWSDLCLTGGANAHIGEEVFLLFEATEADLADIDLQTELSKTGRMSSVTPILPTDMYQDPTVGDGPMTQRTSITEFGRVGAGRATHGCHGARR